MGVMDVKLVFDNVPANGFEPGCTVSGRVMFTTDKPVRMKNITLFLQGRAKVRFHTREIQWLKYVQNNWRDETILGFGSVFNVNWSDFCFQKDLKERKWFKSEQLFVGVEHQVAGESCLHLGFTEYPFSFPLPHNLPPTFNSTHGEIRYKIKVKWSQCGFLAPSDTYKVELPIVNPESLGCLQSTNLQLLEPRVYQDVRPFSGLFSTTDPLKMEMKLPKSAVVSGETINAIIQIDNSTQMNINTVSVKFIQRTAWLGKYWTHKNLKTEDVILQEVHYSGVPAQTSKSWTQAIDVIAKPIINIEPCSIIKFFHLIMVEVVPSGIYNKLRLVAPVEVCFDREEKFSNRQVPDPPSAPSLSEFDSSEPPPPYSAVASMSEIS